MFSANAPAPYGCTPSITSKLKFSLRTALPIMLLTSLAACGGSRGGSAPPAPSFTLSGSVDHLNVGGLVITNGTQSLTLAQGATSFAFSTAIANASAYTVTVATQPAGENCVVNNGMSTVAMANVTNIAVVCNTAFSTPTTLGVIPVGPSSSGYRVLLPISMVGDSNVVLSAVLDTGSGGTVLNALDIFPPSMVSASGFIFPAGQTSMTYEGITVTNVGAVRTYGGQSTEMTMDSGNIGFAQLTFESGASIATKAVPILFVYQTNVNGVAKGSTSLSNLVGVNATASPFTVPNSVLPAGSSPPYCSPSTTTTCLVASPFRYFTFTATASEGFVLNKVTLNNCSSTPVGSCPVQNALVLGLNSDLTSGFNTTQLTGCTTPNSPDLQDEMVCSQVVQGVTVASGGASFSGPAIFDSGEPDIRLSVPQGSNFPVTPSTLASGTIVSVTTPSGFAYQFSTGTGYLTTGVVQADDNSDFSNLGIEFFTQNSFLLNYANGVEGWK